MKLIVPYIHEQREQESRLVHLAEFLGIDSEALPLASSAESAAFLDGAVPGDCTCIALNPDVMKEWLGGDHLSMSLVKLLSSRFQHLLVYGLRPSAFHDAFVAALSNGKLDAVRSLNDDSYCYEMSKTGEPVCGAFSGISFGPVNPSNDHVLAMSGECKDIEVLISINDQPFMATASLGSAKAWFVASRDVVDLHANIGSAPLAEYFSSFLPFAMALRHAAGEDCWRPNKSVACVVIDDPLLRKNYGFLNFESLLTLCTQYNFHSTIAFIPHNFARNSAQITRMFRENPKRLSICFHGNDHTNAELATTDRDRIERMVAIAKDRIEQHEHISGLACDNVMVFPQGKFSTEAMSVLRANNFDAAVNTTPYPYQSFTQLTIAEVAQPAVTRYEQFPLFLRRSSREIQPQDVAFNLFFGRPILIGEHHDIFKDPQPLLQLVSTFNSMAPQIEWCSIGEVVSRSVLIRKECAHAYQVCAYSGRVQISNEAQTERKHVVHWGTAFRGDELEAVAVDGVRCDAEHGKTVLPNVSLTVLPGTSRTCTLIHQDSKMSMSKFDWRWTAKAIFRRRLSEFRDNYLSKSKFALSAAKVFQRRFLRV